MKKKLIAILKLSLLVVLIAFLFAFTSKRNQARMINGVQIEFVEEQDPYVNENMVNKLLIQKNGKATNVGKETLDLNIAEYYLDDHKMIEHSDVYLTVSGKLKARIKQRTPIARVQSANPFYVDVTGGVMPLSKNFAAHVPIVYNISKNHVSNVYPLLKKIDEDDFLKKHIIGVRRISNGNYELGLRVYDFDVVFGKIEALESKVKNFKAFYQKALKDKSLNSYKKVSLQYSNQVVCTIK